MVEAKLVYLFPGQGAQYSGMALDFLSSDSVKQLFKTALDITGKNMEDLLQSEDSILKRTDISQPAITLASLAAAAYLGEVGYKPAFCAGFSLGEYAALVCSGIINAADCFRLVKARGEAMQKAAERLCEENGNDAAPGMAAVTGLAPNLVQELAAKWKEEGLEHLYPANINSSKQVVVSGTAAALSEAEIRFKEAGARRVLRLNVAGPFHCPLMNGAAEDFAPVLETVTFNNPAIPVYSNVTGRQISSGEEAKKLALLQITHPVLWTQEQAAIARAAADNSIKACLEVGPGRVLQGLWKDSGSNIPCLAAGTKEDIGLVRQFTN